MTKKELLARIEELERKVAELELANACKPVIYVPWQQPQEEPRIWPPYISYTTPDLPLWGRTTTGG